jgi:dihydrofolate reductase
MSSVACGSLMTMGKLTYGMGVSVDGFVNGADGTFDWAEPDDEQHQYWNDVAGEIEVSLYGRRMWELMSAYWPTADEQPDATPLTAGFARAWRAMPKVVFSTTLESVGWNARLERGDVVEVARRLKAETDGLLEVSGATLAAPLVRAGLVDEFRIAIAPAAAGGGTSFFPSLPAAVPLRLVENRTFPGGAVLLRYETVR